MESVKSYITRGYWRSVLLPVLFTIPLSLVIVITQYDPTHKSYWLTSKTAIPFSLILVLVNFVVIMLMLLTIFTNRFAFVRRSLTLSALSWFTPLMLWCSYLFYLEVSAYTCVITAPYVLASVITFWKFRKRIANSPQLHPLEVMTKENRKIRIGSNSDGMPGGGDMT